MCCDKTCYDKSWYVIQWLKRYKKETGSIFFYLKKESECVKNNLHIMNRKKSDILEVNFLLEECVTKQESHHHTAIPSVRHDHLDMYGFLCAQ